MREGGWTTVVSIPTGGAAKVVGYGGLLAAAWVIGILFGGGAACVTNPVASGGGQVMPVACIVDRIVFIISDVGAMLERCL